MKEVDHKIVLRNDYNETYAPVAKLSTIRSVIGIALEGDLKLNQMDVTIAYLNGELEENIVMKYPERLEQYLAEIMVKQPRVVPGLE